MGNIKTLKRKTPQQDAYSDVKKSMEELEQLVNDKLKVVIQEINKQHPEFSDFRVVANNKVYKKQPEGYHQAVMKLAEVMLYKDSDGKTQKALLDQIQPLFPSVTLHASIWQRQLNKFQIKKIATLVKSNCPVAVSLIGCKTLSQIREKIKVAKQEKESIRTFKAEVIVTKDVILVNKKDYPLTMRTVKEITYPCIRVECKGKRVWQRMDVLVSLLRG